MTFLQSIQIWNELAVKLALTELMKEIINITDCFKHLTLKLMEYYNMPVIDQQHLALHTFP